MATATLRKPDHGDYRNGDEIDRAQITVIAKADPKPGQKTGSVKDADLGWFRAWPEKLEKMERGRSYQIEYNEKDGVRYIKSFELIDTGEPPAVAQKIRDTVREVDQRRPAQRIVDNSADYDQATPARRPPANCKDEMIFVEGALNRAVQNNQVNVHDTDGMVTVVNNLRDVWARTFGSE